MSFAIGNQAGVKITSPAVTREYDEDDDDGDQSQADNLSDSDSQFNCDNVFAGDENSNDVCILTLPLFYLSNSIIMIYHVSSIFTGYQTRNNTDCQISSGYS